VAGKFYAANNVGTRLNATYLNLPEPTAKQLISRPNVGVYAVTYHCDLRGKDSTHEICMMYARVHLPSQLHDYIA